MQLRGRIAAQNTATGVSDMFGVSRKCVQSSTVSQTLRPTMCAKPGLFRTPSSEEGFRVSVEARNNKRQQRLKRHWMHGRCFGIRHSAFLILRALTVHRFPAMLTPPFRLSKFWSNLFGLGLHLSHHEPDGSDGKTCTPHKAVPS